MIKCDDPFPAIDVIVVNYNGISFLPNCLRTLFESNYPDFSVIVVDNGSTDGSVQWIRTHYPQATVLASKGNDGFGKGNTKGVLSGTAEYVALLNTDTEVDKNWLMPLIQTMIFDKTCAAACSQLVFTSHPEVINAAGGGMNWIGYGYDRQMFMLRRSLMDMDTPQNVLFPTAAACLIRRSAFFSVGGFDPSFFMYHEDVDLGWRLNLAGYVVKYVPQSIVKHAFGGTSNRDGMAFRNRLGIRHALRSVMKNYEAKTLFRVLPQLFSLGVGNYRAGVATGFFRGVLWNLLRLPSTVVERARVQRGRKVSDEKMTALIWQDIYLPVYWPDYPLRSFSDYGRDPGDRETIDLFSASGMNLGYGWYQREPLLHEKIQYFRWTGSVATFYLWHAGGESVLSLTLLGLVDVVGRNRRFTLVMQGRGKEMKQQDENVVEPHASELVIQGREKGVKQRFSNNGHVRPPDTTKHERTRTADSEFFHINVIETNQWETHSFYYSGIPGPVEVTIDVHDPWIPHDRLKNRDYRTLGIGVREARLTDDPDA